MDSYTPYIIGLTGGIGSGKSVVSRLLRLMDIPVYDCDREAKRLMCEDTVVREGLIAIVGEGVFRADGQLDRAYLASYMFGDDAHVRQVNQVVHPVVRADFKQWALQAGRKIVAVESAILFEAGMAADVDAVWVIHAPENMRLQRVVCRDSSSDSAVRSRMQCQLSEQEYLDRADRIISNDNRSSLVRQVAELLHEISDK